MSSAGERGVVAVAAIEAAIETVQDPCSKMLGAAHSLRDLGMLAGVDVEGSLVRVRFMLDDPGCIFFFELAQQVEEAVKALSGVERVEVVSEAGEVWGEQRIRPPVRAELEELRARARGRILAANSARSDA